MRQDADDVNRKDFFFNSAKQALHLLMAVFRFLAGLQNVARRSAAEPLSRRLHEINLLNTYIQRKFIAQPRMQVNLPG